MKLVNLLVFDLQLIARIGAKGVLPVGQEGVLPQLDIAGLEAVGACGLGDGGLSAQDLDDQRGPAFFRPALDVLLVARLVCLVLLAHGASSGAARRSFCQRASLPSISRQSGFLATGGTIGGAIRRALAPVLDHATLSEGRLNWLFYFAAFLLPVIL